VVLELRDNEKIAQALNCSLEAAKNMHQIVVLRENPPLPARDKIVVPEKPSQNNPKDDALDWSYEREKHNMAVMSRELLKAMLVSGQHFLSQERAQELRVANNWQYLLV